MEAEAAFRRAITLNPSYATAHHWYAVYLTAMGRFEEGRAAIGRAQALEPTSLIINTDLGFVLYYGRQYDAAVKQLQMVTEINPEFGLARLWLGRAYQEKAMYEEAIAEFRRAEAVLQGWPVVRAAIGYVRGCPAGSAKRSGRSAGSSVSRGRAIRDPLWGRPHPCRARRERSGVGLARPSTGGSVALARLAQAGSAIRYFALRPAVQRPLATCRASMIRFEDGPLAP